ncbi:Ppx/GppA phosphatase family protein [Spirulina major CS-329]|uniref:Ppx/GppA phosphatase family protein n=1 Tax=Spirulina TaxID=1154 RepID=UPI00232FAF37|nr:MULTISPECIES: Ppx/GppA phosphatase family protein [Spirulina]MDB9496189.1 Ppx/GppA phosphatase family protein [Spirulina subsalsa CS-330]MDB9502300.1 Ppx/GppA phosphatase family protein [Spirulina major CS-329]
MAESLTPQTNPRTATEPIILGAIDIGTNSIHMVVVKIEPQFPSFSIIAKEKDTVRLGDRDLKTGKLTPEAIDRALAALRRCQDLALSFGAQHLLAVATSATREAPNGQDFIRDVEETLGLQINLISGPEEARRIYLGVLSGLEFTAQPHVIIDIGGGSTELILCDRQDARFLSSTKVGAVRLTQEFVHTDPITPEELTYLRAYVRGMLERPVEQILANLKPGEVPRMIGTSGTIETLAILQARSQTDEPPNPLNGYTLSRAELEDLTEKLAELDYDDRAVFPGMSERRAEIIVAGAIILLEAMEMLGLEKISICERALREGIIVDWMLTHQLIADKLQYQSAVRDRSIYSIAKKYHVKLDYSERVAEFAVQLFDQLHGKLHFWNENERELLWAAGMLHNSGLYISHAAHHKHSYYLIRHAELLGYTDLEVELIANIARYHRKSKPKKKHPAYHGLTKPDRQRVDQLSAILRLAVACDRRQIGAIARVHCTYDSHHDTLRLHLHPTDPNDACELELWSLDYKKDVFEEEYSVTVTATVG